MQVNQQELIGITGDQAAVISIPDFSQLNIAKTYFTHLFQQPRKQTI